MAINDYEFVKSYRDLVLRCSSCGFCQAQCPVFGLTLRPALNARGKMLVLKEVMDGKIPLNDELMETLFQCTTCANCSTHCPSGVSVPEIIKAVRRDMVASQTCHPVFEGMNKVLGEHTNIYAEDDPEDFDREHNQQAENVFFIGCVGLYREDETTEATLDLLDRLEVDYTLIDEVCCTGVLEDVGYAINQERADQNIKAILATGAKRLITGCPYCFRTFVNKPQYQELRDKVEIVHISQFLNNFDFGVKTDKKVTYHDPCDLGRHTGHLRGAPEHHQEDRRRFRGTAPQPGRGPLLRRRRRGAGRFPGQLHRHGQEKTGGGGTGGSGDSPDRVQLLSPQPGQRQTQKPEV